MKNPTTPDAQLFPINVINDILGTLYFSKEIRAKASQELTTNVYGAAPSEFRGDLLLPTEVAAFEAGISAFEAKLVALQDELRVILESTKNTPESFIDAYEKISIATHEIFNKMLNELSSVNAFDPKIKPKQILIEAYAEITAEMLEKMVAHAVNAGTLLSKKNIEEKLKPLKSQLTETANQAAAHSFAAAFMGLGWLALASFALASNPAAATVLATTLMTAEICKMGHEFLDIKASKPTTSVGRALQLWSEHANLSEKLRRLEINKALISEAPKPPSQ